MGIIARDIENLEMLIMGGAIFSHFQMGSLNSNFDDIVVMLDEIDKVILSNLGKNARTSSYAIAKLLHDMGYQITDRAIRQRLKRLEQDNTILGYSIILNPTFISEKVNRTFIIKFKYTNNSEERIIRLEKYTQDAPYCVYAARLSGDFDWISHYVFDSREQYELESNNFLHRFADLIADYRTYDSKSIKISPYLMSDEHALAEQKLRIYKVLNSIEKEKNLNNKLQLIVDSLVKYLDAKFARIWLVDKEREYLILKYSAGRYKNINGEFSKVPVSSYKIGAVFRTKKPVVTNDVTNDPRIKHPEWAKHENLRSFGGYPLIYKNETIGVLAMFSEKKLLPTDFEILGIFSEHISQELANLYDAKEILGI